MNKQTIITVLLALVALVGQGQTIKTDYEDVLDSLPIAMQQYMAMQGVQHFRVILTGDFNGKRAKLKKITCDNGKFDERILLSDIMHLVFTDSIERLDFMAVPFGSDSLRIACFYPECNNYRLFEDKVKADNMKILLETLTPGNGPDYPVIAYSSGIPVNGGTWFCGLRDAGIEPRLWYEKHGINDYVYYTVTLQDDVPFDGKADFYLRISKEGSLGMHKH
ncbi:MAG: hypothetical protein IJK42_14870 [Prevotella sp.]|nr:hypothetical protein [Prevotella sp.]MBQ6211029.1 hypothetical protein [Prevotella sp.]